MCFILKAHYLILIGRQMRPDGLEHRYELIDEETALIRHLGLYHILHLPEVMTNRAMITALVKR